MFWPTKSYLHHSIGQPSLWLNWPSKEEASELGHSYCVTSHSLFSFGEGRKMADWEPTIPPFWCTVCRLKRCSFTLSYIKQQVNCQSETPIEFPCSNDLWTTSGLDSLSVIISRSHLSSLWRVDLVSYVCSHSAKEKDPGKPIFELISSPVHWCFAKLAHISANLFFFTDCILVVDWHLKHFSMCCRPLTDWVNDEAFGSPSKFC